MTTCHLHTATLVNSQQKQEPALERKDLGSCPLGTIGNLQFNAKQGGTRRATAVGVWLSDLRRSLSSRAFRLISSSKRARMPRESLNQIRKNSRHIGNLLGSLTARASDVKGQRRIAQELARLGVLAGGDLANLKGWRYCLSSYLDDLTPADLEALVFGAAGSQAAREAVLDRISSDVSHPSRKQASLLLNLILHDAVQRLTMANAKQSLSRIAAQLSCKPLDGQKLRQELFRLAGQVNLITVDETAPKSGKKVDSGSGVGHKLGILLQSLSDAQLQPLLPLAQHERLEECLTVLGEGKPDEANLAREILNVIQQSLAARLHEEKDSRA